MKISKIHSVIAWSLLLTLVGCASNPAGTAGAGYGSDYTPVIDGQKTSKYHSDLDDCRNLAKNAQEARNNEALKATIIGGVLGALVGGAIGGRDTANFGASYGAIGAGAGTAGQAISTGKQVIVNCMSGRGWRVVG
jgi:uncharacterized protein YcfJ